MTARAALSTINLPALTMSYTLSTLAVVVTTPGMFRADSTTFWFTSGVTTSAKILSVYDIVNANQFIVDKAALAVIEEVFA